MRCLGFLLLLFFCTTALGAPRGPENQQNGKVEGWITGSRCGAPIPYANVVIIGTSLGAMTDEDGHFEITRVPVGKYAVRVMSMTHETMELPNVEVEASEHRVLSVELTERWSNETLDATIGKSERCEVHNARMGNVLISAGYGLPAVDPKWDSIKTAQFPNAERSLNLGCVIGKTMKARSYLCPQCIRSRNVRIGGDQWNNTPRHAVGWQKLEFANAVRFRVPVGVQKSDSKEGCAYHSNWIGDGVKIEGFKGPITDAAAFWEEEFQYVVNIVIDGCYPDIGVVQSDDESADVIVRFWASPLDTDRIVIRLKVKKNDALIYAREIISSIEFL